MPSRNYSLQSPVLLLVYLNMCYCNRTWVQYPCRAWHRETWFALSESSTVIFICITVTVFTVSIVHFPFNRYLLLCTSTVPLDAFSMLVTTYKIKCEAQNKHILFSSVSYLLIHLSKHGGAAITVTLCQVLWTKDKLSHHFFHFYLNQNFL